MATKKNRARAPKRDDSNRIKDPDDWTTGDEPMTGAQESYLHTLAEASKRIDELQHPLWRRASHALSLGLLNGDRFTPVITWLCPIFNPY